MKLTLKNSNEGSARLRVYANSSNTAGWSAHRFCSMNWTETGITYNSAPPPGTVLKTSPTIEIKK